MGIVRTMSASYGISTYGKEYVVGEGFAEVPPLRYVFVGLNVLLWLVPTVIFTNRYLSIKTALGPMIKRRQTADALSLLTGTYVSFMINNILRSIHMVDHIYRPVYYHEPKWAYAKIWITEMEVPTYANIFMAFLALQGMLRLLSVISEGVRTGLGLALGFMFLYVLGSLFNLVHYTIEPVANYGAFANFNIIGTAVTNVPLIYHFFKAYAQIPCSKPADEVLIRTEVSAVRSSGRKRAPVTKYSY